MNLRNGGFVRGQIVEHDPASGTTILLADGSKKHFDAADVLSIRSAASPTNASSSSPSFEDRSAGTPPVEPAVNDDETNASFRPHLRAGFAGHLGTYVIGGGAASSRP